MIIWFQSLFSQAPNKQLAFVLKLKIWPLFFWHFKKMCLHGQSLFIPSAWNLLDLLYPRIYFNIYLALEIFFYHFFERFFSSIFSVLSPNILIILDFATFEFLKGLYFLSFISFYISVAYFSAVSWEITSTIYYNSVLTF